MLQFFETTRFYSLDDLEQLKNDLLTSEEPFLAKLDFSGRYLLKSYHELITEVITLLISAAKPLEYLELDLRYGDIQDLEIEALKRFLKCPNSPAVISLDLRHNSINDEQLVKFIDGFETISNSKIRLNLGHNQLKDDSAYALAKLINHPQCPLETLTLEDNYLTGAGAIALAEAL